jgi:hypothetical protein
MLKEAVTWLKERRQGKPFEPNLAALRAPNVSFLSAGRGRRADLN